MCLEGVKWCKTISLYVTSVPVPAPGQIHGCLSLGPGIFLSENGTEG